MGSHQTPRTPQVASRSERNARVTFFPRTCRDAWAGRSPDPAAENHSEAWASPSSSTTTSFDGTERCSKPQSPEVCIGMQYQYQYCSSAATHAMSFRRRLAHSRRVWGVSKKQLSGLLAAGPNLQFSAIPAVVEQSALFLGVSSGR